MESELLAPPFVQVAVCETAMAGLDAAGRVWVFNTKFWEVVPNSHVITKSSDLAAKEGRAAWAYLHPSG